MSWIKTGILRDVDKIIYERLNGDKIGEPPHYDKPSFCRSLKDPSLSDLDGLDLITKIYDQILDNLSKPKPSRIPSKENWRWRKNQKIREAQDGKAGNTSPEVGLEKAIVKISPQIWPEVSEWSNQAPTSSGLLGPSYDKKRAIDLVHRWQDGKYVDYEFIELKVGSNNPVSAAMEIMVYGMLYVLSRDNREGMRYVREKNPLLWGRNIHLQVLAPYAYYVGHDLARLEKTLGEALGDFLKGRGFWMDFEFQEFPQDFDPRLVLQDTSSRDCQIIEALSHRKPVYPKYV